ncbi:MAG: GNAT family N-acetyltransferase [Clostridiales bacterium]|nr:GNAT family N-acetyltransferase [Clostridiales bacterium]MCD7886609.1 GNAT family N-acetyltransferase [Clostridiales bacterium]
MEISIFQDSDIEAVFGIQQAAYKTLYEKYHDDNSNPYLESKETVFRKYTRKGTIGYIFTKNGTIVGAVRINLYPESRSGRVSALAVHPQYQNQGIAQQALLKIEEIHNDVEKWFLDTILQEEGNCHLYEKIGYIKTGKTEKINERMTLVFYEKQC